MTASDGVFSLSVLPEWLDPLCQLPLLAGQGPIAYDIPATLPPIHADARDARAIASLLGISALQHTQPGEPVTVLAKAGQTSVDLTLRITPSALFQLLFKNLAETQEQQTNVRTLQTAPDSLVLLKAAHKLAGMGRLRTWVQMEKEKTAALHLYLPTVAAEEITSDVKPLVLIIEDTKMIGSLMELYLRQAGFRTMLAHDGVTGLQLAREHHPDMITLDVMMPEMDGWQVLLELKSDERTRGIPSVIVSVLKDRQIGFELGAADYLTKPVVREDLVECARRMTSRPARPVRTPVIPSSNWVLFTSDPAVVSAAHGSFADARAIVIDLGTQKFFDDLLHRDAVPELFVIDTREQFHKALAVAGRLRLYDAFDPCPIVALCDDAQTELVRGVMHGLADVFHPGRPSAGSLEACLSSPIP